MYMYMDRTSDLFTVFQPKVIGMLLERMAEFTEQDG